MHSKHWLPCRSTREQVLHVRIQAQAVHLRTAAPHPLAGPMSGEICTACGGLGATVERYPVKDEDGYEYEAWRDVPCAACGGTGRR